MWQSVRRLDDGRALRRDEPAAHAVQVSSDAEPPTCRLHGGKSTGPRTPEGLEASRRARLTPGVYSRETKQLLAENRRRRRELCALLDGAYAVLLDPTWIPIILQANRTIVPDSRTKGVP